MISTGHCKFDISDESSEFCDFYDLELQDKGSMSDHIEESESLHTFARSKDIESLHFLLQNNLYNRKLSQKGKRHGSRRPRLFNDASNLESSSTDQVSNATSLTKAQKRSLNTSNQMMQLNANDRRNLIHLPSSQQHAILATQRAQLNMATQSERLKQANVDRKNNKTLRMNSSSNVYGTTKGLGIFLWG